MSDEDSRRMFVFVVFIITIQLCLFARGSIKTKKRQSEQGQGEIKGGRKKINEV